MNALAPAEHPPTPPATAHLAVAAPHPFGLRLFVGVSGVLVAAIMSGLNNRVGGLVLPDIRGNLGYGFDDGKWITTVYTAAELAAMPLSAWFAVTLSLRRYHIGVVLGFTFLGLLMPYAPGYGALLAMRALQGLLGGALIPVLMSAALRFFPLHIRLYGLSLYSLTATFAPNLAIWLAAAWTDQFFDWRLAYWQIVPLSAFSIWAVWWGIPQDPLRLARFREADWPGLVTGSIALVMIAVGLDQGERLDWFHSALICWLLGGGVLAFIAFLISEFYHHVPFVKLQLLERRNLWLGFTIFVGLLITLLSGSLLPADQLADVQGFRPLQLAPIGLLISLPQLLLAPLAAWLLYQKWIDALRLLAAGLVLIALSCWVGSFVTSEWMVAEFVVVQALQAFGQPFAVVAMLFLATSVVAPMEGPFVSGLVNTLRAFSTLLGSTIVGHLLVVRHAAHARMFVDRAGRTGTEVAAADLAGFAGRIAHQAFTLSIADCYRYLGLFALLLVPLTFFLQYIPPPTIPPRGPKQG